jgi:hypothetical protein
MDNKLWTAILIMALLILPCSSPAQEQGQDLGQEQGSKQGRIRIGNLKVIPSFTGEAVWDDNIYLKNGDESLNTPATSYKKVSDWIYHAKPGLLLNLTLPERGHVNLGYNGDFAFYNDNTKNNWKNNQGLFDFAYIAPGGLIAGVKNVFTAAEDPFGSANNYAIGTLKERWNNDLNTRLGFRFSENFRSIAYYNFYKQAYKDITDSTQDYLYNEFGIGIEARFMPKTWGFLRYYYGSQDFYTYTALTPQATDSDFTYHRALTGVTWDVAAKLQGELNFGYQWKSYDHKTDAFGRPRMEVNDWIAATSVNWSVTDTTRLTLSLKRALRDTGSASNEYFIDTGIGASLRQTFLTKFTAHMGLNYSINDYNTPITTSSDKRSDKNYSFMAGLNYQIRDWLGVDVGYKYNKKDSNDRINEFQDNQFSAAVNLVY